MALSVLHVAQPTDGGVGRYVAMLASAQAPGFDVTVACPSEGELAVRLRSSGVPVIEWDATRDRWLGCPQAARQLRSITSRVRPDLIHLHSSMAGLLGRIVMRGRVPTVFQPHAWSFQAVANHASSPIVRWERTATRWVDRVICVSSAEQALGEAAGVEARYSLVPNAVEVPPLAHASDWDRREAARKRLDLSPGSWAVCVGRLCRQKGQDLLVDLWPRVQALVPDARLALVGDGPTADALPDDPSILKAGATRNVMDWYDAADVVVLPSRWEGMALVPLEAMAAGRSVVSSDVGGAREAIPETAGAVVRLGDERALVHAVAERLLDQSLAAREGQAGREHVGRFHRWERVPQQMAAVYEGVLTDRQDGTRGLPGVDLDSIEGLEEAPLPAASGAATSRSLGIPRPRAYPSPHPLRRTARDMGMRRN